jgi:glutathione peroxidase
MMNKFVAVCAVALFAVGINPAWAAEEPESALDFTVDSIAGKPVNLSEHKGKVVLIVNVASECRNTPQYEGLESLYKKYRDRGFTVLGFPSNVRGREPGTNEEIAKFCDTTYKIDFPLFAKIVIQGEEIAPLYEFLTSPKTDPQHAGPIKRNFEKFLIGRDSRIVARFATETTPESPEVVERIESELQGK